MNQIMAQITLVALLYLPQFAVAADFVDANEIMAKRGKGQVTQEDFGARANRIPEDVRRGVLRDGNRVRDLLNDLLLRAQLAADAQEAGFDQEKVVIRRMRLAAEAELADAWLQHYVEIQPPADYEQLAREYYQINQENMLSTEEIDVSHILVSTTERSDEEAKALAESLHQQLIANPAIFNDLVTEYSEDPSASSNNGSFKNVKKGDMVKEFEETAFALEVGEISAPVKTNYGYHIIRIDDHVLPQKSSFDEVKEQLIETEKSAHDARIKRDYLSGLTALDVEMSEEALEGMVRRQFGEDYVEAETGSNDSE
jgi:peptidyl-prolyl cis-trans isomerase C